VREEIGQGAYGVVRIATDKRDSTQYAMKMLSKRKMQRASFGMFVRLEACCCFMEVVIKPDLSLEQAEPL
jgi:serine/threonine protein kinase